MPRSKKRSLTTYLAKTHQDRMRMVIMVTLPTSQKQPTRRTGPSNYGTSGEGFENSTAKKKQAIDF
jgi:hypothetical protein